MFDSENLPIENVLVVISNELNETIAYSYTDKQGFFNFKFENNSNKFTVAFNALGFEKLSSEIDFLKTNKHNLKIVLTEKIEILNEIILQSKISNDTTTFKVEEYLTNTEQTVEDILKKIPGIEVLSDGTIKAHGKYINKLLVEGDDILDKNYKLLSKNLDANVIESVQILDNFEDNPVLKKLFQSEKVALNLKLKKNKQNVWFGNVNLGAGLFSENRWKEGVNLGLLRKKIKFFYFADYNNSGEKATDVLIDNIYEDDVFGEDRYERKTTNLFEISSNENTTFSQSQSVFNKSLLNSVNFTTRIKPQLVLRGVTYIANDDQVQKSFFESQYNIENEPIVFTENNNYRSNKTLAGTEIEAKYFSNAKHYFTNTFVYKNNPNKIGNTIIFNDSDVSQNAKTKNNTIYNHFKHTFFLTTRTVINNYVYFGHDNSLNTNSIKSPFLNDFLNVDPLSFVRQDFDNSLNYYGFKTKLLKKSSKLEFVVDFNYENNTENLRNTFSVNDIRNENYENNLIVRQNIFKTSSSFRYRFTKRIYVNTVLNHTFNNFRVNQKNYQVSLFNPSATFNYEFTKSSRINLNYRLSNTLPEVNTLLRNSILSSYRSFVTGTSFEKPVQSSSLTLNYYLVRNVSLNSLSITASYNRAKDAVITDNTLNSNFSFSNYLYSIGGKNFLNSITYTKYIRPLKSSLLIGTTQSFTNNLIKINSNELSTLRNYNANYKFSFRTYIDGPFNMDFNMNYHYLESNFKNAVSTNNYKNIGMNLIYNYKKTVVCELNNQVYTVNNENYYFTNGVVNFNPIESNFSYRLVLNNLFNRNQFTSVNIDNYTSYTQSINLVPRYFLLNVKYRF